MLATPADLRHEIVNTISAGSSQSGRHKICAFRGDAVETLSRPSAWGAICIRVSAIGVRLQPKRDLPVCVRGNTPTNLIDRDLHGAMSLIFLQALAETASLATPSFRTT